MGRYGGSCTWDATSPDRLSSRQSIRTWHARWPTRSEDSPQSNCEFVRSGFVGTALATWKFTSAIQAG